MQSFRPIGLKLGQNRYPIVVYGVMRVKTGKNPRPMYGWLEIEVICIDMVLAATFIAKPRICRGLFDKFLNSTSFKCFQVFLTLARGKKYQYPC